MRYIGIIIISVSLLLGGCNNWLNLKPSEGRPSDSYWEKEEDVHNTMMSCYVRFRKCMERLYAWGELRGDVIEVKNFVEGRLFKEQNITAENAMVQWELVYRVINSANALIEYAPDVLDRDPLFTEEKLNRYLAEAKFVRSLAYFYLVRTFREVPLITQAYVTDEQKLIQPKVSEETILQQLITDLTWAEKNIPEQYGDITWQTHSRGTKGAVRALLADVYLWAEDYENCIAVCQRLKRSGRYKLMEGDKDVEGKTVWFENFSTGLTDENIFEFYYSNNLDQNSPFFGWFKKDGRYYIQQSTGDIFREDNNTDFRGENVTWRLNENLLIWKFLGAAPATENSAVNRAHEDGNWIVYRYAEVLLMEAEAYAMVEPGNAQNYQNAIRLINQVRTRANAPALSEEATYTELDILEAILDERKKEFMGEGRRWFDMVRFAKKENFKYKAIMTTILLKNVSILERPIYETRLSQDWSFFLPIHQSEIDVNKGVLRQNPAYIQ